MAIRRVLAILPLLLVTLPGSSSAHEPAVLVGTWQQLPGLPVTGCAYQNVRFLGVLDTTLGGIPSSYVTSFSGSSSTCENLQYGQGSGWFSDETTGPVVVYARSGNLLTFSGRITVGYYYAVYFGVAQCNLTPTSAEIPVTVFEMHCALTLTPA